MKYLTCLEWTINDFKTVASPYGQNSALISDDFSIHGTSASAYLVFCPTSPLSAEDCSLLLQIKNVDKTIIEEATINLWITNKYGYSIGKTERVTRKDLWSSMKAIGLQDTVEKSALFSPNSNFVQDNKIVIICEIVCTVNELPTIQFKAETTLFKEVHKGCVVLNEKEQFYVSKQKLISSSVLFKALLDSNQSNGIVHVRRMESEIFEELKHYILFGNLSENWPFKSSKKIYELVNEYELDHITLEDRKQFLTATTEKALIDCFKMGFQYNDIEMKTYAFQKLRDSFSSNAKISYFETQEWITFAAANLEFALKIKVTVYKAIEIIPENYKL